MHGPLHPHRRLAARNDQALSGWRRPAALRPDRRDPLYRGLGARPRLPVRGRVRRRVRDEPRRAPGGGESPTPWPPHRRSRSTYCPETRSTLGIPVSSPIAPPTWWCSKSTDLISPVPGVELVPAPWTSKRPLTDLVGGAVADLVPGATRPASWWAMACWTCSHRTTPIQRWRPLRAWKPPWPTAGSTT